MICQLLSKDIASLSQIARHVSYRVNPREASRKQGVYWLGSFM